MRRYGQKFQDKLYLSISRLPSVTGISAIAAGRSFLSALLAWLGILSIKERIQFLPIISPGFVAFKGKQALFVGNLEET